MSPGRSNKPLFEVLSQHPPRGINPPSSASTPPARPDPARPQPVRPEPAPIEPAAPSRSPETVHAEPKPRAVPGATHRPPAGPASARSEAPSAIREPEPASVEADEVADAPPRPVVTIPLSTVYSAVALGGALIFIAWIAGHTVGANNKQAELTRGVQPPDMLSEPSEGAGTISNPGQGAGQTDDPARTVLQNPQSPATSPARAPVNPAVTPGIQPSPNGTILSAAGMLEIDPREAGLNYLELGTFSREMTQDAIDYLASSGVPSIGVPQPGGRYRLVSVGLGIPGGQWGAMAAQRTQHQKTVADIGTRWVQERQGGSDFTQTQWTKYQP